MLSPAPGAPAFPGPRLSAPPQSQQHPISLLAHLCSKLTPDSCLSLSLKRTLVITQIVQGNVPFLRPLITPAKDLMPYRVTYSSFLGIRIGICVRPPLPVSFGTLKARPVLTLLVPAPPAPESRAGPASNDWLAGQALTGELMRSFSSPLILPAQPWLPVLREPTSPRCLRGRPRCLCYQSPPCICIALTAREHFQHFREEREGRPSPKRKCFSCPCSPKGRCGRGRWGRLEPAYFKRRNVPEGHMALRLHFPFLG